MKTEFDIYRDKVWNYLKSEYKESMDLMYDHLSKDPLNTVLSRETVNNILLNNIEYLIKDCYKDEISIPFCANKVLLLFSFCGMKRK